MVCWDGWLQVPQGEAGRSPGKSGKFVMETKFGSAQEVACATGRNRDTHFDHCRWPWNDSARSTLRDRAPAGSSWADNLPKQCAGPVTRLGDLNLHLSVSQ